MVAHVGDAAIEAGRRIQHHRHQIRGEFDVNFVEIQHIADGFAARAVRGGRGGIRRRRDRPCDAQSQAAQPSATAPTMKGRNGMPGTSANSAISTATVPRAPG